MDQLLARTMVETLSKGLNPLIGTVLPDTDICASEEIQEALITVLSACTIESNEALLKRLREEKKEAAAEKKEQRKNQYRSHGNPWTNSEEQRALQLNRNYNIWYTAKVLGRSPNSIRSKLARLGVIPNKKTYKK
ncbi:MAG: hypothetical protein RRY64_00375 [Oscillospiraceae bacterium]